MTTLWIDDNLVMGVDRASTREVLMRALVGEGDEAANVTSITETPLERQERLRATWGHDPAAQAQWRTR